MAKMWTVRAKRHINSTIPEGYTICVTTQGSTPDYYELEQALRKAGVDMPWGCICDGWWDWI